MNLIDDLHAVISVREDEYDDYDLLRRFTAILFVRGAGGDEVEIGRIVGWIGWRVLGEDFVAAADAVSADSSYIGSVAAQLLDQDESDDLPIEDVILLDRVSVMEEFRGRGYLGPMVERLVRVLRFDVNGCFLVTDPEPQMPGGGPYPDGTQRNKAMSGLLRSLHRAGFRAWIDGRAHWRRINAA